MKLLRGINRTAHRGLTYLAAAACLLGLLTPTSSASSGGQDPGEVIKIIGAHLKGRLDEDPTSGYNVLLRKVLPADTHYFNYQRYPVPRAIRDFFGTKRACLFPASSASVNVLTDHPTLEVHESEPIDIVSGHIVTAAGRPVINHEKELYGKMLATQRAVVIDQFIRRISSIKIVGVPDDLSALKMINAGRVDAMYGWFPDIYITAERYGIEPPNFNPDYELFRTKTHLVCKKFGGSERLFKIVNTRIRDLRARGKLQEILGKHARIVEVENSATTEK